MKSKLLPIVSAVIVALALIVLALKDNSKAVNLAKVDELLEDNKSKECFIQDQNLYIAEKDGLYKISTDAVDASIVASRCELTTKNPFGAESALFLLSFVLCVFAAYRYGQLRTAVVVQPEARVSQVGEPAAVTPIVTDVTFSQVAGVDEAKEELTELVDYLKNPSKYASLGVRMPKGVILAGPPGVGKTLLAKALANEAGVPFYYKSAATFVEMYVGVGARRVEDLFAAARSNAPAIIFIDEIDAIGRKRSGERNEEREATLNQLLTAMDGFDDSVGTLVIAATNKPEVLDDALLRANRFDRKVFVDLPDMKGRTELFGLYLGGKPHRADTSELARITVGFSGATISSFVNEAALHAIKGGKSTIEMDDFRAVASKIVDGKKKTATLDDEQRELLSLGQGAKLVLSEHTGITLDHISLSEARIVAKPEELMSEEEFLHLIAFYLSSVAALDIVRKKRFAMFWQDEKKARHLAELAGAKYMLFEGKSIEQIVSNARGFAANLISQNISELHIRSKELLNS